MARRLETVYVKTCLKLTEAELLEFVDLFAGLNQQIALQTKVYENGDQEVGIHDFDSSEHVTLSFERKESYYELNGSCRFTNLKLANTMRKALSKYKGDALVHRIYPAYVMAYEYKHGCVVQIVEHKAGEERLVYAYKHTAALLEEQYMQLQAEAEIELLRTEVDRLLDLRNQQMHAQARVELDQQLYTLAQQLFALEA
ncbi:non-ribosomal peptide synthetase module [Marinicrinis sediminis]|uniref:Non-ribosomal peptide synthetase module n=1 Tax=Marinicrinis sediminis TaxID=1652465 RepID=A0ABW5R7V7_9BACL